MRYIIAGPRTWTNDKFVDHILDQYVAFGDTVITGKCPTGVDKMAEDYAERRFAKLETYPADWDKHGKAAGPIRNRDMAEDCRYSGGILIAIWDGKSRGTKNMIDNALKVRLETHVYFDE